jgi:hypothetical protein
VDPAAREVQLPGSFFFGLAAGERYQLKHSEIAGCIIAQALGKGFPFDAGVEKGQETLGDISCPVTAVTLGHGTQFVTCAGELRDSQVLFNMSVEEQLEVCQDIAQRVLATLAKAGEEN